MKKEITMNVQQVAAILRQVFAIAAVVVGALTSSVSAIHLPPAVSSVLVAAGGVILAIEHYVSDPSTGTTTAAPAGQTITSIGAIPAGGASPPPPAP
jgi:hypothetical protein